MFSGSDPGSDAPRSQTTGSASTADGDELAQLLIEVKVLALRLRQLTVAAPEGEGVPATGRQLLSLLQQHGPQSVPGLARRRCTSRQNVQIVVNRLVHEGCVQLIANPSHKRSALLHLTERGKNVLAATVTQEAAVSAALAGSFSHEQLHSAVLMLRELRRRLQHLHGPDQANHARHQTEPEMAPDAAVAAPAEPAKLTAPEPEEGLPVSLL